MTVLACGKQQWCSGAIDTMLWYEPREVSDGFEHQCAKDHVNGHMNGHSNKRAKKQTNKHTNKHARKNEPAIT